MSIVEFDVPHYNPTAATHGPTIDIFDLGHCEQYNETDESGIVKCKDDLQSQRGIYVASGG